MTTSRQVRPADYGALPASVVARSVEPGDAAVPKAHDLDALAGVPRPHTTVEDR